MWTAQENLQRIRFFKKCFRKQGFDLDQHLFEYRFYFDPLRRLIDSYMGFGFGAPCSFDDFLYEYDLMQKGSRGFLTFQPAVLDYIEKYGDLRLKSYYMSLASVRSEDGDLL